MFPILVPRHVRCLAAGSALALAVGFSGCAHTYNVKVDALCNPNITAGATYRIVPKDAVKADFEPQYQHAVQLIETALANKGYFPAETPRDAEVIIEVDLGVGSQRKRAIEDLELFGAGNSSLPAAAPAARPGPRSSAPALVDEFVPEPVPMTRVTVVTFYEKYLSLSARETQRATRGLRKPVEAWRVTVAVEDAKSTVDECLTVLVATAADNIGQTTDNRTQVRVSEKSTAGMLAKN